LGATPTRPDIPAPPLLKAAFTNATKKIPKKMSQVDKVSELTKRRDDLLDFIQDEIEPFMQTVTSNFTDTTSTVFPYMEKQKKQIEGLQEELTKVQKTSSEQAISIGRRDLALQTLRVKSKGLINDIKAREETIRTLKETLKVKAAVSKTYVAEAKARLQVVVAEKKAHLKLDMKDLEFDRKMEWED
jgi:hypothetical protein